MGLQAAAAQAAVLDSVRQDLKSTLAAKDSALDTIQSLQTELTAVRAQVIPVAIDRLW